ncbi:MAG TPA: YrdB family protein [Gammaproteobacteria bacterium]|jgi:hypothetical protein|nr:YrdB family protein [Gammaproteobacteria bacterium]
MKIINLALRFMLELCALAAMGYWGYHAMQAEAGRLALCIAAPAAFALLWWLFPAHKARFPLPQPWKAIAGFLFLQGSAALLALAGQVLRAEVFALLILINTAGLEILGDDLHRER